MNRSLATLIIVTFVIVIFVALLVLTLPVIVHEFANFIESFPRYVRRLQALATDSDRPWVRKIIGEGLGEAERSVGDLTTLASAWFGAFLRSLWSGGRALFSMFSLAIVTPIVAFYLLYSWKEMIAAIDNWVPPARRDTVRELAREIDDKVLAFVRGQSTLCVVLAVFYGVALWLIGLKHGAVIGFAAGIMSFIPYLGSLLGLVVSDRFLYRAIAGGLRPGALPDRPTRASQSGVDDIRAVRLGLPLRLRRPSDRGTGCGRPWRSHALRIATVLCEPALRAGFARFSARNFHRPPPSRQLTDLTAELPRNGEA
jgi:hypothetical protein